MPYFIPGKRLLCLSLCLLYFTGSLLANDDLFISPYGNTTYYKKRQSEKDFSASGDYDFSVQLGRIDAGTFVKTTIWKNKTILEKLAIGSTSLSNDGYYIKSATGYTPIGKAAFIYAREAPAPWTYTDPETKIELTCTSRLYDTVFTGVLPRQAITVIKKGKGLSIKEVYIEGFGLTVLVVNGVIYTQILGDYDVKKDMMENLGYTDPMGCVLVNQTNMSYLMKQLSVLFQELRQWADRNSGISKFSGMEWIAAEAKARVVAATLVHTFKTTDLKNFTLSAIADFYLSTTSVKIAHLDKNKERDMSKELQSQYITAFRERFYTVPDIDAISRDVLNGDRYDKSHKNHFGTIARLALEIADSTTGYPFADTELNYLFALNHKAEERTPDSHPRYHQVNENHFLIERLLTLTYHRMIPITADESYKKSYIYKMVKYAINNLYIIGTNSDSSLKDIYTISESERLFYVKILDQYGSTEYASTAPDRLWLIMCRLGYYDRAFEYFKKCFPDYYGVYAEHNLPLVEKMCQQLNNTDEVVALISKKETGNDKFSIAYKCLAYLHLNRPGVAIELIKTVRWGPVFFFVDENAGQKILQLAYDRKQQTILDYFYTAITETYNLNKVPKKQYNQDRYEELKVLSHLTEKFGNQELSSKIYKYYMDMYKYR